nr:ribokinase [Acidipropionibacterium timonense]
MDLTTTVRRHPVPGETLLAQSVVRSPGGKGGNQAVGAARAGRATTSMVGWVGTDPEGELLRAGLEADGIDVQGLERVDGPSGLALITVDGRGENWIIVVSGANMARSELSTTQLDVVASADVLLSQLEIPLEVVRRAAIARHPGVPFVLNAAPAQVLPADLLALVDILVVNEHEARAVSGLDDPWQAAEKIASGGVTVLMTLGPEGSVIVRAGQPVVRQAARKVEAVDTTAAGGHFLRCFLCGARTRFEPRAGRCVSDRRCSRHRHASRGPGLNPPLGRAQLISHSGVSIRAPDQLDVSAESR